MQIEEKEVRKLIKLTFYTKDKRIPFICSRKSNVGFWDFLRKTQVSYTSSFWQIKPTSLTSFFVARGGGVVLSFLSLIASNTFLTIHR
jgi:hypothetical protein